MLSSYVALGMVFGVKNKTSKKDFDIMKKVFFVVVSACVLAFYSLPAMAGDEVNVVIHSDAWGVGQIGGAIAVAPMKATATATNIASLSSLDGENINVAFVHSDASEVLQLAGSYAESMGCGSCGKGGIATATATNIAGLSVLDIQSRGDSYIHAGSSAVGVAQGALSVALGGKNAVASATNLAGVTTVSVNID